MASNYDENININYNTNANTVKGEIDNLTTGFKTNSKAVLENGGAMGLLNDLTGGYAMMVKDAVEALGLFTKSQQIATAATEAQTVATEAQTVATSASVIGLKALRVALAATGIGLLIVAVGVLVANWDRVTASLKGLLPSMDKVSSVMNKITEIVVGVGTALVNYLLAPVKAFIKLVQGDFSGAVDEFKNGLNVIGNYQKGAAGERLAQQKIAHKKEVEELIKTNEDKIKVLEAGGKDAYALELKNSKLKQSIYKDDKEKLDDALLEERILRAKHSKQVNDAAEKDRIARKKANDAAWAERKKASDEYFAGEADKAKKAGEETVSFTKESIDQLNQLQIDLIADELTRTVAQAAETERLATEAENIRFEKYKENHRITEEELQRHNDTLQAIKDTAIVVTNEAEKKSLEDRAKASDEFFAAEADRAIKKSEDDKKTNEAINGYYLDAANSTAQALLSITELSEGKSKKAQAKSIKVQSAVNLAMIGANTAAGIMNALGTSTNTYEGVIKAAAVGVAGIAQTAALAANTKKALAALGSGGAAEGGGSAGGSQGAVPNVSFVSSSENQLQQSINAKNGEQIPVKAYVLTSDVNNAQAFDDKVKNKTTM